MATAYRFDDEKPRIGSTVHAFSSLSALKEFASLQGSKGSFKFYELEGKIIENDGSVDGIKILIENFKQI